MQVFLVGGAVRDYLLGYPPGDRDWVVVGGTPEALLAQGFKPVGKDFPVFLHPTSQEEYALARTERKTAPGYQGFAFNTGCGVTLEEDLSRRDLTLNAMAQDAEGRLIDPFGGADDIRNKQLRHVSPAFAEDPVRILRLARFAARYAHLGFVVAPSTLALAKNMVQAGEVDHLVAERVWQECARALSETTPSVFFEVLRRCGALKVIMPELDALFGVPQTAKYHPEIDTGIHTLLSLQQACLLSTNPQVRWATLLHDLGKAKTPAEVLPSHHGHEKCSLPLVNQLCRRLNVPNDWRNLALKVAEYHTHCHRAFDLNPKTLLKLFNHLDVWRKPSLLVDFCMACEADAKGRTGLEHTPYPQAAYLQQAFAAAKTVDVAKLMAEGFSGAQLGQAIARQRLAQLQAFKQNTSGG